MANGWYGLTLLGVLNRGRVADASAMRPKLRRLDDLCVRSRAVRDERGIALIMTLGVMLVLTVVLTTVIFLTASGARDANHTNAGQKAYAVAEAGLNNALAQLAPHYPILSPAGDSSWVSGPSQAYPGGGACLASAPCVAWTGVFSGTDWTLTGTGTVPNPSGGTSPVVKTVSATLHVSQVPTDIQPFGIFSDDPQAQCTDIGGNVSVNVPIYIRNCMLLHGTFDTGDAKIWEPSPYSPATVTVNVVHALTLNGAAATIGFQAGAVDHRVKSVAYGSCVACTGAIHALSETSSPDNSISLPALSAAGLYSGTNWAGATCTGTAANPFDISPYTRNNTGGNLFPGSGNYSCTLTDSFGKTHSIAYDAATHALSITNSWYIDGDVAFPNATINYTGKGTIYVNGSVSLTAHAAICASPTCTTWDPTNPANPNLLIVALNASSTPVASPFTLNGQAMMEASAWAVGNGTGDSSPTPPTATCATGAFSSTGSAYIGGSVWTQNGCSIISGGGVLHTAVALPSGSPTSTQFALLSPITGYNGG